MSGCTETGKPRIAILMAVYEPRMDWLREQLLSLDAQVYPNLMLYVRDDCSPTVPFEEIQSCVQDCIRAFPYEIQRNEKNLGSNGTFELLTQEAEGEYFAYCDQDDVWLPEKLEVLERYFEADAAVQMTYSDLSIIDAGGKKIADTIKEIRPRIDYLHGNGMGERFFFRNPTAGCSMLIRKETAREALPFPRQTVCDQWLSIVSSIHGKVAFEGRPLVEYRQHENNQTGILTGITDRNSYRERKIEPLKERLAAYRKLAEPSMELTAFVTARNKGNIGDIFRYRRFSPYEAMFEIVMRFLPDRAIRWILRRIV